jgi:hypothetical protein
MKSHGLPVDVRKIPGLNIVIWLQWRKIRGNAVAPGQTGGEHSFLSFPDPTLLLKFLTLLKLYPFLVQVSD